MLINYIELAGENHPICFSAFAMEMIEDQFGGMKEWSEQIQSGKIKVYNTSIDIFLQAGMERMITEGRECPPPIKGKASALLGMEELKAAMEKIMECVSADAERTVEVRSKNA